MLSPNFPTSKALALALDKSALRSPLSATHPRPTAGFKTRDHVIITEAGMQTLIQRSGKLKTYLNDIPSIHSSPNAILMLFLFITSCRLS